MEHINISESRANLLSYLKKAQAGQPFMVTSNGEVLAIIVSPVALQKSARKVLDVLACDALTDDLTGCIHEKWQTMQ